RRSMALSHDSPSFPQGWPYVWRLSSPFSSCPPFSSSWRISFCLPPSYLLFLVTSFFFVMLSSSSFSFRLFSLFSSPCSISFKVVEQKILALWARTIQPPAGDCRRRPADWGGKGRRGSDRERRCRAGCR